jgi:hypothetical protein
MLNTTTLATPKDSALSVSMDNESIVELEDVVTFASILQFLAKDSDTKINLSQDILLNDETIDNIETDILIKDKSKELFLLLDLIKSDEDLEGLLDFIKLDEDLVDLLELVKIDNSLENNLLLNIPITEVVKIKKTLTNIQDKLQTQEVKTLKQLFSLANEKGLDMTKISIKTLSKNDNLNQRDKTILKKEENKIITLQDLIQTSRDRKEVVEIKQENIDYEKDIKSNIIEQYMNTQGDSESSNSDTHGHTTISNINTTTSPDIQKQSQLLDAKSILNLVEDLKEHINKFKAPLMKISLEINPNNMGKLDIEIISRGGSLYLNFNSNQQAIGMIMNNLNEFKNALSDMGFNDVEMNFSSNSQNDSSSDENNEESFYQSIDEVIEEELDDITNFDLKIPIYL